MSPLRRLRRSARDWVIARMTRLLTKPLTSYELRVPNNIDRLKETLHKGDVLLVEGNQRVSQVIRYLTQSSWSHSALYVGNELLEDRHGMADRIRERFADDAEYMLIEAVVGEGVIANPISKYESYNIRICRPQGIRPHDIRRVLGRAIRHIGDRYDVQHIWDLARYFFPVGLVPRRWRRAALRMGSRSEREVICSGMIARSFAEIGYPILPEVVIDPDVQKLPWWRNLVSRAGKRPRARFRPRDPGLITPRDFDLSPYFDVIKFNHLADPRFSYLDIVWETRKAEREREETDLAETA